MHAPIQRKTKLKCLFLNYETQMKVEVLKFKYLDLNVKIKLGVHCKN